MAASLWHWLTTNGIGQNVLANGLWALVFGPWVRREFKKANEHRAAHRASVAALHAKIDNISAS